MRWGIAALLFAAEAICAPLNLGPIQLTEHGRSPDVVSWVWCLLCAVLASVCTYVCVRDYLDRPKR